MTPSQRCRVCGKTGCKFFEGMIGAEPQYLCAVHRLKTRKPASDRYDFPRGRTEKSSAQVIRELKGRA